MKMRKRAAKEIKYIPATCSVMNVCAEFAGIVLWS